VRACCRLPELDSDTPFSSAYTIPFTSVRFSQMNCELRSTPQCNGSTGRDTSSNRKRESGEAAPTKSRVVGDRDRRKINTKSFDFYKAGALRSKSICFPTPISRRKGKGA
jgi:hypothetical protein